MRINGYRSIGVLAVDLGWQVLTVAVLASLVSYWSWTVVRRPSQPPPILAETRPDKLANLVQVRHLFGAVGGAVSSVSPLPDAAQMVLVGIVSSGSSGSGVAVILLEGKKAVTAKVGQEIMPNVILSRVADDHVELTQRGQTINLRLATKK